MTLNDGGKQRIEEERMDSGGEENCILLALCDNAISVPEFSSVSVVSLALFEIGPCLALSLHLRSLFRARVITDFS